MPGHSAFKVAASFLATSAMSFAFLAGPCAAQPNAIPPQVGAAGSGAAGSGAAGIGAAGIGATGPNTLQGNAPQDGAASRPPIDPAILSRLTLADVERLLPERNRDLLDAQRRLEMARADRLAAGARPNPNLSLSIGNYDRRVGLGGGPPRNKLVQQTVGIDQLIERGGKRELRLRTADHSIDASRFDLADTLRLQRLAAQSAYYDVLMNQETVRISRENARLFAETAQAAQRRFKAGDIARADVDRIEVDRQRTEAQALSAEGDLAAARQALATLLAADLQAQAIVVADDWPQAADIDVMTGADRIDALIDQRADVQAARSRIEAARAASDLARSLRTRDVTVGAQYQRDGTQATDPTGPYYNYLSIGISIPLQINYAYEGEIARASAALMAAEDDLARARGEARGQLTLAAASLRNARARIERYQTDLLPAANRVAEAAEFAFRRGAMDVIDVLDARRTLRATQLEALDARADYAKALAAWRAVTQAEKTSS